MNSIDLFIMGFKNLFRRKTRTMLTVLGVVIGTAAIVVMVSLGIGMDESFENELKRMGSLNMITVTQYQNDGSPVDKSKTISLNDKAVAQFQKMKGVEAVHPIIETSIKLISGKYVAYAQVMGADADILLSFGYIVEKGRLLQTGDKEQLLFGFYATSNFYNPKSRNFYSGTSPVDVMKDKLSFTFDMNYGEKQDGGGGQFSNKPSKVYKTKAVGVLKQTNDEKDYYIYMDINYLKKLIRENSSKINTYGGSTSGDSYQRIMVKVKNINDVDDIQQQIKDMGYGTYSLADIRESMKKQSNTIQMVLGGIGAISLLIAALGITNTMVMSIYERTREIGVMKVLGCRMNNIRQLFLFEAAVIGLIGGVIGILLSYIASFVLNSVGTSILSTGNPDAGPVSVIPPWLAAAAIMFSMFIGIVSGFYPASRAMKLSALEAIKTE